MINLSLSSSKRTLLLFCYCSFFPLFSLYIYFSFFIFRMNLKLIFHCFSERKTSICFLSLFFLLFFISFFFLILFCLNISLEWWNNINIFYKYIQYRRIDLYTYIYVKEFRNRLFFTCLFYFVTYMNLREVQCFLLKSYSIIVVSSTTIQRIKCNFN